MDNSLTGLVCGVAIVAGLNHLPGTVIDKYEDAMNECEKDLPRTQHCVITAKVAETSNNKEINK